MQVIPAIDLRRGRVVRLRQGDFERQHTYGDDPAQVARDWAAQGSERLHIVDLDGAVAGHPVQLDLISRVIAAAGVPCQVGGGMRDPEAARAALTAGADRVVLGTALLDDRDRAAAIVAGLGADTVIAALDVRDGRAVSDGWQNRDSGEPFEVALDRVVELGVSRFAVTAVDRDGTLTGPDLRLIEWVRGRLRGAYLVASGGVASLADLRVLADLGCDAVIVGRALYEGTFTLTAAIEAAGAS